MKFKYKVLKFVFESLGKISLLSIIMFTIQHSYKFQEQTIRDSIIILVGTSYAIYITLDSIFIRIDRLMRYNKR